MKCLSGKTKGTCIPACPSYGMCHCGECGLPTKVYGHNKGKKTYVYGEPCINRNGHHDRVAGTNKGRYSYTTVPIERVRPLVTYLRAYHGGLNRDALAARIGLSVGAMNNLLYDRQSKRVSFEVAAIVVAAVTAVRNHLNPDASHLSRIPTPFEQTLAVDPKVARNRDVKRRERARKQLEEAS